MLAAARSAFHALGFAWLVCVVVAAAAAAPVEISVSDKATGRNVPCRIHLTGPDGKAVKPPAALPFFKDHFVCAGQVRLDLPPGEYRYEIERGPEYTLRTGTWTVAADATQQFREEIARLVDMPAEGWWPGETHVHRLPEDVELLMQAEDLHVAQVITWWFTRKGMRNVWNNQRPAPANPLVRFDGNRFYHLMAGEDERQGGALLFFNLPAPLDGGGATAEYPSPLKFVEAARRHPQTWIDVEKPFWYDVPIWLASGQVDSIGLANNHMDRSVVADAEATGKARDRQRFPPPYGNGLWSQEIYYHILNSGLRIPPSAGSASGVLPNPLGYDRVYVQVDGDLTYEKWLAGLRAGRSFVTNGPLLRVRANGRWPGAVFTAPAGTPLRLEFGAALASRDKITAIEIIKDGRVERTVSYDDWARTGSLGSVPFDRSGWCLVRAITTVPYTFRFASTAPFYVEIGDQPQRISKSSVQFFVDWLAERTARLDLADPAQREEVLATHQMAKRFWEERLAAANVD